MRNPCTQQRWLSMNSIEAMAAARELRLRSNCCEPSSPGQPSTETVAAALCPMRKRRVRVDGGTALGAVGRLLLCPMRKGEFLSPAMALETNTGREQMWERNKRKEKERSVPDLDEHNRSAWLEKTRTGDIAPPRTGPWLHSTAVHSLCRLITCPIHMMWTDSPLLRDAGAALLTGAAAATVLRFWEEVANRALLDQKLCRKLVHITVGLVYFLMWPLFSADDVYAPFLAPLILILNIIKVSLIGLGVAKDDGVVNSMTRHGDYRELLKGPLYYACAITLTTMIFWRTSPISIAVICNLCAGDGVADIVGRQFGHAKLPHNPEKSYAGTIAMLLAGFTASVLYMCYFNVFGFVEESWTMVVSFSAISLAAAVVESLPISTRLDDNLTVPLASALVGGLVFYLVGARNL